MQVGIGINTINKYNPIKSFEPEKHLIYPGEFGLHSTYQITPIFGLKLGRGYRYVYAPDQESLSGYYSKIGLSVDAKLLWKKLKTR